MPKKSAVKIEEAETWWEGHGSREDDVNLNNRLDMRLKREITS